MIVEPADQSSIVAASGPPQFVPAAQLEQSKQQLAAVESHVAQAVDEYKSAYPLSAQIRLQLSGQRGALRHRGDLSRRQVHLHQDHAPEKFSVYEMRDGKPNLITYDLNDGTYIIPKVMDSGYVELGKKRMEFTRKG